MTITITSNGSTQTIVVPGTVGPGGTVVTPTACVNTRTSAVLGPLPRKFKAGLHVTITSFGHTQRATVVAGRKVNVDLSNVPCGVFPMAIRAVGHPGIRPAWRIWSLTGGNGLRRFWFPGAPGVSNFTAVGNPGGK